ncbi:hypothetical protein FGE12_26710 [Aggregicoccus sp. 17bor-14]|uniref:hypothetical protein n=1 Tax=Myxococcaceae TaxID=31 RepID=UPI00129CC3C0|nr:MULTISPECIES: hypothetical protein [Myxococcaceae]MBF5046033.1 hypothetical protein [Simulacricoccus sp. 17bor-14]MRI91764.1 hypothetical protein [Aggregicoccus sp. 17bor-14]
MPFFLPALALTALGLGVKHALDGDLAFAPSDLRWRRAWLEHREAVRRLREARGQLRTEALALAELQRRAVDETARPFLELMERLERWECLAPAERLPRDVHAMLEQLSHEPPPDRRDLQVGAALRGAGGALPPALTPLLTWLERGWVHVEAPVRVAGVSVFEAVACGDVAPPAQEAGTHAVQLEGARAELARVHAYVEALTARLRASAAALADVHGCASAQLAYLDPQSFEPGCVEAGSDDLPRARLRRLGVLVAALARALQRPLLEGDGTLLPAGSLAEQALAVQPCEQALDT